MSCLSSHISRGCNRGEVYFKAHDSEGKHIHERAESMVFRGGGNIVTQEALDEEKRTKSGGVAAWVAPGSTSNAV